MNRTWRTMVLALRGLRLHLLRSTLTVLGIMFGVASVIAMLAVGEGASQEAQAQIKALGSTNIILKSLRPATTQSAAEGNQRSLSYGLKYADAELIRRTVPGVKVLAQSRDYPKKLRYRNRASRAVVRGTVPWFQEVAKLRLVEGSFFSDRHQRRQSNVCVMTPELVRQLFLYEHPIGKVIKVGLEPFTVIGVAERHTAVSRGSAEPSDASANVIYIPISTSLAYFGEQIIERSSGAFRREHVELHEIQVQVENADDVMPVAMTLRRLLEHNHEAKDYEVVVPLELLRAARESKRMFGIVLATIAAISLLVGGIGIMNIMLASVTERTREIGIRRALGAQKRHIVMQFLVETVMLSVLGGLMGISLGLFMPFIVTAISDLTTIILPEFVVLSLGISGLVGVTFGIYPAIRAASLDPIEALRHE